MSRKVLIKQPELALVAVDHPRLFALLSKTMLLQPLIDPSAGYGAFQIAAQLLSAKQADGEKFNGDKLEAITNFVQNDTNKLYVLVRAYGYAIINPEDLDNRLKSKSVFNYPKLVRRIRKLDDSFNRHALHIQV